jgi:uncharacterized protein
VPRRARPALLALRWAPVMDPSTVGVLAVMFAGAAVLYASVGHAGASGYLASMALLGLAPGVMRPVALVLNVAVATIATAKFYRAGCFDWRLFWPFALMSVPLAVVGGMLALPGVVYRPIVGAVLLFSALRLLRDAGREERVQPDAPLPALPRAAALGAGAAIGLLSGLTGVGGGIFLSPLVLLMGWADVRRTAGVSAAFILVNSLAGLVGLALAGPAPAGTGAPLALPAATPLWVLVVVLGGWVGAELGSRRIGQAALRRVLALVLVVAGLKLALG